MKRMIRSSLSSYKSPRNRQQEISNYCSILLQLEDGIMNLLRFQDLNSSTQENLRGAKYDLEHALMKLRSVKIG